MSLMSFIQMLKGAGDRKQDEYKWNQEYAPESTDEFGNYLNRQGQVISDDEAFRKPNLPFDESTRAGRMRNSDYLYQRDVSMPLSIQQQSAGYNQNVNDQLARSAELAAAKAAESVTQSKAQRDELIRQANEVNTLQPATVTALGGIGGFSGSGADAAAQYLANQNNKQFYSSLTDSAIAKNNAARSEALGRGLSADISYESALRNRPSLDSASDITNRTAPVLAERSHEAALAAKNLQPKVNELNALQTRSGIVELNQGLADRSVKPIADSIYSKVYDDEGKLLGVAENPYASALEREAAKALGTTNEATLEPVYVNGVRQGWKQKEGTKPKKEQVERKPTLKFGNSITGSVPPELHGRMTADELSASRNWGLHTGKDGNIEKYWWANPTEEQIDMYRKAMALQR